MPDLPPAGTRVSLRYRLPPGSVPPLTDVVGHLLDVGDTLRVRTKRGEVIPVAAVDVVSIRPLGARPVRTADIRNLEHAAALAWPGVEQHWHDGWLLRFGHGSTRRANSALPLNVPPGSDTTAIVDWYSARGLPPLLVAPDRLLRVPVGAATDGENLVMTRELAPFDAITTEVTLTSRPTDEWLGLQTRDIPFDVLTAVRDGDVAFGVLAGSAAGRAAVTGSPDGTRWAGLSSVHVDAEGRRRGLGRTLCNALLNWAVEQGATRAYVQVLADNTAATRLYESMGFGMHHRSRYLSLG